MSAPLELWGGHECTVNRVGDRWRDQTILSGHHDRIADLDAFASLGLKALRYPILWERVETERGVFDWSWADARMVRLSELGLRPVVGLLHHGSGPRWTDLLDPGFAAGLGEFAGRAAERYPWVTDWTPVNEPLTTARFSALYGHWHPHGRDEGLFWSALLNQIEATRAAMAAMSPDQKQDWMAEVAGLEGDLARAMGDGFAADDAALDPTLAAHHDWVGRTWRTPPTAAAYAGLGELYSTNPEFRARYEALRPGLADWLAAAMKAYGARELSLRARPDTP